MEIHENTWIESNPEIWLKHDNLWPLLLEQCSDNDSGTQKRTERQIKLGSIVI